MTAWATIVVLLSGRLGWNHFRLMRHLRGARRVEWDPSKTGGPMSDEHAGRPRAVPLWISERIEVPAVVGLVHPRIVLPAELFGTLPGGQIGCIIAHELAHVRWRDVWVAFLERVVGIIHFFNPALWFAAHFAHAYREIACDEASLEATQMDRRMCGATLLEVLEFAHRKRCAASPAIAMFERARFQQRRLRRIMTLQTTPRHASIWSILLLLSAAIVVIPHLRAAPPDRLANNNAPANTSSKSAVDKNPTHVTDKEPTPELVEVIEEGPLFTKVHDIQSILQGGTDPDMLVALITTSVVQDGWDVTGGRGSISIDRDTSRLRVIHVDSVQQAIARLLSVFESISADRSRRGTADPFPAVRFVDLFAIPRFQQIVRVYVVPSLVFAAPAQRDPRWADYDSLIELTTSMIDADSWDEVGGPNTIEPWTGGDALVIAQTQDTQDKIFQFYAQLGSMPNASSGQIPTSVNPIEMLREPVKNADGLDIQLQGKIYPVHDLLPRETKPVFRLSPRCAGLNQLYAWLVAKASPTVDEPIDNSSLIHTKGVMCIEASAAIHQRMSDALADVRQRMQMATSSDLRAALEKELFPALFPDCTGGYPRGGTSDYRVFMCGECDADQQLALLAVSSDQICQVQLIATDVTDTGLEAVRKCGKLRDLAIWSPGVSEASIARLIQELPHLQRLSLQGEHITDALADAIAAKAGLDYLDLPGTSISDAGLNKIIENRQWLMLDVSHTKVTRETVESLRKTHPHLHIDFEK